MKKYQIAWDVKAEKQLKKIDKTTAKKIYEAVGKDLAHDPYGKGDMLLGQWTGYRSYHFTRKYRIIYKVFEEKILVHIVKAEHRKYVYKSI